MTTAALRHLVGHLRLKAIDLNGLKFTAPLSPLARCPALESLDFFPHEKTKASDAQSVGLDRMVGLRRLNAYEASFGERSMTRIGHLAELRYLKMTFASIRGDDGLRPLAQLLHLEYLELSIYDSLSDECLRHLAGLNRLCSLSMGLATGDGDGLRHLAGLKALEYLNLAGDGVADAGLRHLHGLTNLRVVRLECDRVSRVAAVALAEALPEAAVHWQGKVFRTPQPFVRFRRSALKEYASVLIPIHWQLEDCGYELGLVWLEDGYGEYNSDRRGEPKVI